MSNTIEIICLTKRVVEGADPYGKRVVEGADPYGKRVVEGADPYGKRVVEGADPYGKTIIKGFCFAHLGEGGFLSKTKGVSGVFKSTKNGKRIDAYGRIIMRIMRQKTTKPRVNHGKREMRVCMLHKL